MIDPYIGAEGVLTGAARAAQEARERGDTIARAQISDRRRRDLDRRRATTERQIAELRAALLAEEGEVAMLDHQEAGREHTLTADRAAMAAIRGSAQ